MVDLSFNVRCWTEGAEFDSGVGGGETPVGGGLGFVALLLPGGDGGIQFSRAGEAPVQALTRQNAQFDLRYPPKKAIRASRHIMTDTVQQLLDVGSTAPESERMAILQDCIERFNAIDAEMDHFIETAEREDICEEFEAIAHACGLGAHEDLADQWRDW